MIKLYICCLVLIIGGVEVGPDIDMKFHQEVMDIFSYDIRITLCRQNFFQFGDPEKWGMDIFHNFHTRTEVDRRF